MYLDTYVRWSYLFYIFVWGIRFVSVIVCMCVLSVFICFPPEVIFRSRDIGAWPVTTDWIVVMSLYENNSTRLSPVVEKSSISATANSGNKPERGSTRVSPEGDNALVSPLVEIHLWRFPCDNNGNKTNCVFVCYRFHLSQIWGNVHPCWYIRWCFAVLVGRVIRSDSSPSRWMYYIAIPVFPIVLVACHLMLECGWWWYLVCVCCTQEHDGDDPFYIREFHIPMRHYVY